MMIEERIAALEEIVRGLHAKTGHIWFSGDFISKGRGGWATCACGESEVVDYEQYTALPSKYQLVVLF